MQAKNAPSVSLSQSHRDVCVYEVTDSMPNVWVHNEVQLQVGIMYKKLLAQERRQKAAEQRIHRRTGKCMGMIGRLSKPAIAWMGS